MDRKAIETIEKRNIICPYCQGRLSLPVNSLSVYCNYCNRHVDVGKLLTPVAQKKKNEVEKRKIFCYKCHKEILVDKNAQAVMCKHCYHRNDLSNHKVKRIFGTVLQTHGELYLQKRGVIETSTIQVGSAIIKGKVLGNITSYGTVEILKRGEVKGNIICRKLIVRKGAFFEGYVQIINPDDLCTSDEPVDTS